MTRILVVDDDVQTARMLVEYLTLSGYQPVAESDGLRALQHVDLRRPDLIILDLMLPVVTGVEVSRRLRLDPRNRDIPILAITSFDQPEDLADVLMVDLVLTKPMDLDHFGECVAKLLKRTIEPESGPMNQSTIRPRVLGRHQ